jgi:hypothetical protein
MIELRLVGAESCFQLNICFTCWLRITPRATPQVYIRAHQVAAFVQAVCIALRAVAVEQFLPLYQNLSLCLMTPDCEFLKRKSPVRAGRG